MKRSRHVDILAYIIFVAITSIALPLAIHGQATTQRAVVSGPSHWVAVNQEQIPNMPAHVAQGVRVFYNRDGSTAASAFVSAVDALPQFCYYILPVGDIGLPPGTTTGNLSQLQSYSKDPHCLGFVLQDEPDATAPITPAATLITQANWIHVNAPGTLVFCNFDGAYIIGAQLSGGARVPDSWYQSVGAACDAVSGDIYPVSGWNIPQEAGVNGMVTLVSPGDVQQRLAALCAGQRTFIILETCRQNLSWLPAGGRSPTLNEFSAEFGNAMIYQPFGIVMYTNVQGGPNNSPPYQQDGRNPAQIQECQYWTQKYLSN